MNSSGSSSSNYFSKQRSRLRELSTLSSPFYHRRKNLPDLGCSSPLVPPPSIPSNYNALSPMNSSSLSTSDLVPKETLSQMLTLHTDITLQAKELTDKQKSLEDKEFRLQKLRDELLQASEELSVKKQQLTNQENDLEKKEQDLFHQSQLISERSKSLELLEAKLSSEQLLLQKTKQSIIDTKDHYSQLYSELQSKQEDSVSRFSLIKDRENQLNQEILKLQEQQRNFENFMVAQKEELTSRHHELAEREHYLKNREESLNKTLKEQEELSAFLDERESLLEAALTRHATSSLPKEIPKDTISIQCLLLSDEDLLARESVIQEAYSKIGQKEQDLAEEVAEFMKEIENVKDTFVYKEAEFERIKRDFEQKIATLSQEISLEKDKFNRFSSSLVELIEAVTVDYRSEPEIVSLLTALDTCQLPDAGLILAAAKKISKEVKQKRVLPPKSVNKSKKSMSTNMSSFNEMLTLLRSDSDRCQEQLDSLSSNSNLNSTAKNVISQIKSNLLFLKLPNLPNSEDEINNFLNCVETVRNTLTSAQRQIDELLTRVEVVPDSNLFDLSSPSPDLRSRSKFGFRR
ncbi:hypothetical protein RCL1_002855 [Eukaryota sp. TZLM3-RCL]